MGVGNGSHISPLSEAKESHRERRAGDLGAWSSSFRAWACWLGLSAAAPRSKAVLRGTQEGTQPWLPRDCGSGHSPTEKGSHFSFRPWFSICRSREPDQPSSTVLFIFKGSVVYKRCLGLYLQFP